MTLTRKQNEHMTSVTSLMNKRTTGRVNGHLGTERSRSMKKQLGNEVTRLEPKLSKALQGDKSTVLGVLVSTITKPTCVSSGQKPAYLPVVCHLAEPGPPLRANRKIPGRHSPLGGSEAGLSVKLKGEESSLCLIYNCWIFFLT